MRRIGMWMVGVVAAMVSLAAGAEKMVFPGAQWEEARPEEQGVDGAKLAAAVEYLAANTGKDGTRQMVIVRNGYLIWKGDDIDAVHGVWSMTKSFTSTALGLLIEDGKCTLETLAKDHAPELAASYPSVTLRHFATMTSGYRAVGDEPDGSYLHGPSKTPFTPAAKPLFSPPGSQYAYWDSAMNEFAHILTDIAGEPLEALFKRRIADPIGMDKAKWRWGNFGKFNGRLVNGGSGNSNRHIFISAREMARFGHLFLNRGNWNGRQLIRRRWVEEATAVQAPAELPWAQPASNIDGRGVYGYNWWVNGTKADGKRLWPSAPAGTFAALGFNNNKCIVVPEWNVVVVRLGLDGRVKDEVWDTFLAKLAAAVGMEK